jgi:hypothetical protein
MPVAEVAPLRRREHRRGVRWSVDVGVDLRIDDILIGEPYYHAAYCALSRESVVRWHSNDAAPRFAALLADSNIAASRMIQVADAIKESTRSGGEQGDRVCPTVLAAAGAPPERPRLRTQIPLPRPPYETVPAPPGMVWIPPAEVAPGSAEASCIRGLGTSPA